MRSMSGTATDSGVPNIRAEATCFGNWSTVLAVYRLVVPSARMKAGR